MPVFRLSMKIIKKNIPALVIYIIVFLGITLMFASQSVDQDQSSFTQKKINMAIISEENSPMIEVFREELSRYANFIPVADQREALQDALYYRSVEYILRIPKGFTESFVQGDGKIQLEKTVVPDSVTAAYMDMAINRYLNTTKLYIEGSPDLSQEQRAERVKEDLGNSISVNFQTEKATKNHTFAKNYFNYLAYSLFAVLISGISTVMMVLNDSQLQRRNACAPVSRFHMNMQSLLGYLCFTAVSWGIMMLFYFLFDSENAGGMQTAYFLLNSFVFALCASSIGFFIGNLVKSRSTLSAICNVVALGPCFISGIFVPQELLSPAVLRIASFTPTYWFAKANGVISTLSSFDSILLKPVFSSMMIQMGFALAFLSLALVINKKRRSA